MKRRILGITGALSFLVFLIFLGITNQMVSSLSDQNMAERWNKDGGVAQISCFFSANANVTEDTLREFEFNLENYLQESSITIVSENPGARLWTSAYSAEGTISLSTEYGNMEADALGIGGDFFLFHPQKLLYGSYFSGNDVNQDYCVIDEDAAWQLFGSDNVAGMMVTIGGTPHIVTGVIERQEGRMWEAAGLDKTRVYVSLPTLEKYGTSQGVNHYEILMPNPVKQFAYKYVSEKLGQNERETEVLENSTRFGIWKRFEIVKAFGTRSMNGKSIIYPYWENVARGYEDIVGVITSFMILLLLYPAVLAVIGFIYYWRHKNWTFKSVWIKMVDMVERFRESRYKRKCQEEDTL